MKKEIKILYKRPGKALITVPIPNELEWFQAAVEGPCEMRRIRDDLAIIINYDRTVKGMATNFGLKDEEIAGPVAFVGRNKSGFTDVPVSAFDLYEILKENGLTEWTGKIPQPETPEDLMQMEKRGGRQ